MLRYGKFLKSPGTLLLAGAAAFAYYKYNKMSPQQKKDFVDGWKEKGRKLFGQLSGQNNHQTESATANGYKFGEGNQYTG